MLCLVSIRASSSLGLGHSSRTYTNSLAQVKSVKVSGWAQYGSESFRHSVFWFKERKSHHDSHSLGTTACLLDPTVWVLVHFVWLFTKVLQTGYKKRCLFWLTVLEVEKSKLRWPHLARASCCVKTWQIAPHEGSPCDTRAVYRRSQTCGVASLYNNLSLQWLTLWYGH